MKYIMVGLKAGSGKSHFIFQKIVIKALSFQRKILVARKTAQSNANSTFQLALDTLSAFHILKYCKVNNTTQKITLPNGSVILFVGVQDVERLKSITGITDIFIEEATELTLEDFLQLNLRLRASKPNLQMFIAFNPVSKSNWCYKMWFSDQAKVDQDTTMILHTTYKDNRFLPKEYVEAIESYKETDMTYYKIYALGEFATLDKLVFTNWEIGDCGVAFDAEGRPLPQMENLCGLDWGFTNDKTAFIFSLLDEDNKTIYICDAWGSTGMLNRDIAKKIIDTNYGKALIIADSSEPKSIEEVKEEGVSRIKPAKKGKGSILAGIQKLKAYKIIINPELEEVIEEFSNYSWKKDKSTGEYINEPIDEWNHYIDALRYSLQCSKKKLRTLNKSAL